MEFYSNEKIITNLKEAIRLKRISHSYLFYGPDGVGKKTIAKFFAQSIFCERENFPCGVCPFCLKFLEGFHPDFFEVGGKNSSCGFKIDEVRKIIEESFFLSNDSNFKIFLLNRVDCLLPSSSNALLKILEEPPKNTIFLLTANNKNAVLETISSRCISFFLTPLIWDDFLSFAKKLNVALSQESLREIFVLTGGIIGKVKQFMVSENAAEILNVSENLFQYIVKRKEFEFCSSLQKIENDLEFVMCVLEAVLGRFLIYLEDGKTFKLEDVLKMLSFINSIENVIANIKTGGNVYLNLSVLSCKIFS